MDHFPQHINEQSAETSHQGKNLLVVVQSILTGFIISAIGTVPWAVLVWFNIKYLPEFPWSVPPTIAYLWFYWRYLKGKGWPAATSELRKRLLRANQLTDEVWGAAILAGILGIITTVILFSVLNHMIRFPVRDNSLLSHIPLLTLLFMVIMGSIVAGVVEEAGFRGYMQGPIEKQLGPVVAILITGFFFGWAHFSHKEVTIILLPYYMSVAAVYGTLAYLTKSILPGLILHAVGDILDGISSLTTNRAEWQTSATPKPLIWESGTDATFWISCIITVVLGALTFWAYKHLADISKNQEPEVQESAAI
jgi:membrane protease YdiL (CAAX protease family)